MRSLQELCRVRVVSLVREKLMQERPTRGGIFAPLFSHKNCPFAARFEIPIVNSASVPSDVVLGGESSLGKNTTALSGDEINGKSDTAGSSLGNSLNSDISPTLMKKDSGNCSSSGKHVAGTVKQNTVLRVCGRTLLQESDKHMNNDQSINRNPIYHLRSYNPDRFMSIFTCDTNRFPSAEDEETEATSTDFDHDENDSDELSTHSSSSDAFELSTPGIIRRRKNLLRSPKEKGSCAETNCTSSSSVADLKQIGSISKETDPICEKEPMTGSPNEDEGSTLHNSAELTMDAFFNERTHAEACADSEVSKMVSDTNAESVPQIKDENSSTTACSSSKAADDYVASKDWRTDASPSCSTLLEKTKRSSSEGESNSSSNSDTGDGDPLTRGNGRRKKAIKRQSTDSPRSSSKLNKDSSDAINHMDGHSDQEAVDNTETSESRRALLINSSTLRPNIIQFADDTDQAHVRMVSMLDAFSRRMQRFAAKNRSEGDKDGTSSDEKNKSTKKATRSSAASCSKEKTLSQTCELSDDEPEYYRRMKEKCTNLPKAKKKKKNSLWTRGTGGFDFYIEFQHRRRSFAELPPADRLNYRMQDRLHSLPLPPRIQDYLLLGRWPRPSLEKSEDYSLR